MAPTRDVEVRASLINTNLELTSCKKYNLFYLHKNERKYEQIKQEKKSTYRTIYERLLVFLIITFLFCINIITWMITMVIYYTLHENIMYILDTKKHI